MSAVERINAEGIGGLSIQADKGKFLTWTTECWKEYLRLFRATFLVHERGQKKLSGRRVKLNYSRGSLSIFHNSKSFQYTSIINLFEILLKARPFSGKKNKIFTHTHTNTQNTHLSITREVQSPWSLSLNA